MSSFYTPENKVSVGVIQRLHGTVLADKATKVIVAPAFTFSDPAIREVKKIKHQISLMDYVILHERYLVISPRSVKH